MIKSIGETEMQRLVPDRLNLVEYVENDAWTDAFDDYWQEAGK